jgi:hypothetical protein
LLIAWSMRRFLVAQLLVLATVSATWAAEPSRQFFAPAAPAAQKTSRFKIRVPAALRKLSPIGPVRKAATKAKVGIMRHRDDRQIARTEDPVRVSWLKQKKWGRDGASDAEADALFSDTLLVAGEREVETPVSHEHLGRSAATVRKNATTRRSLLPVGVEESHLDHLLGMGLSSVAGKQVYGAPDGVSDVLGNRLVARDVVRRTIKGERGWLTRTQREVLGELLADGNHAGAEAYVHGAYEETVEAVLATEDSYRVTELSSRETLPLVIRAAVGKDPALAARLRALEERGVKLQVRQMIHTPPGVRKAAWEHAAFGEETELGWLTDFVEKGLRPDPRPTRMGVVRAVALGRFSRQHPPTSRDLAVRIALIEDAIRQSVVIEASGDVANDAGIARELAEVNQALDPVRRAVAKHRIVFDVKHEAGESARKLLPMVGVLALTATGLQAAGMSEAAILGAEFGEDALQGAVEGASQNDSGRLKGETYRPAALVGAGGALGGAFLLADPIHKLAHAGHGWAAGPLMGVGAISLSGSVFGSAVSLFKKGRVARLREGKVANTVPSLMFDKDFQRSLRRVDHQPAAMRRSTLLTRARTQLESLAAKKQISQEEADRTLAALEGVEDYGELRAMVAMPGQGALWKAALGEAVGTPTRKALGQGMLITVGASTLIGGLGLLDGPAWGMAVATLGASGEGLWGMYRSTRFVPENENALRASLNEMAGVRERSLFRPSTWFGGSAQ